MRNTYSWLTIAGALLLILTATARGGAALVLLITGRSPTPEVMAVDTTLQVFAVIQIGVALMGIVGTILMLLRVNTGVWMIGAFLLGFPTLGVLNGLAIYGRVHLIDIVLNLIIALTIAATLAIGAYLERRKTKPE
jgi:hypothetical protein